MQRNTLLLCLMGLDLICYASTALASEPTVDVASTSEDKNGARVRPQRLPSD